MTSDKLAARTTVAVMDLTNLDTKATEEDIKKLCERAKQYHVAAVCIYPNYIGLARQLLANNPDIKIATVVNFPHGISPLATVIDEIHAAITDGADEIDVVLPYLSYLAGETTAVGQFIKQCKQACGDKTLKVILETGALQDPGVILQASRDAIANGADFIKTSTGKHAEGASLLAAVMMLAAIKEAAESGTKVGLKISGGIKTLSDVNNYFALTREVLGEDWIAPKTFRIGASSLLDDVAHHL